MKTNLWRAVLPIAALFVLLTPFASAHAAVDRAIVEGTFAGPTGSLLAGTHFMDGDTEVLNYNIEYPIGTSTTEQNLIDRGSAAVQAFATLQGYTLPGGIIWPYLTASKTQALASSTATVAINALPTVARTGSYADLTNKPTTTSAHAYEGTTDRTAAFPIFKSVTVSSGTAVFNLTSDGTSGGTALFPNGVIADSVNAFVSDAAASYQMSYAFTNSNKTLTVTANKLTTANILTGLLGQASANGALVRLSVWGY